MTARNPHPYGEPVTTMAELDQLDSADILEGYLDGLAGEPEPLGNRSKGYWHGWRNGNTDRTGRGDPAGVALIRDMKANGHPLFATPRKARDEAA
jgi:hypothetical protein